MSSSKIVNFLEEDEFETNVNDFQKDIEGFGFTNYSKQKLSKQSNKLFSSRKSLPIFTVEKDLKSIIDNNDNIILIGSTGSGKTTQIPQFLYKWGYCKNPSQRIAITQPRRVAAISIAERVSAEFGSNVGDKVGFHVRFDKTISNNSQIIYLTDGMLLRECIIDKLLHKYSIIILDEAHERTLNTDILFGLIKSIQLKRNKTKNKLKVIIMSATLQSNKFSNYFNNAKIFNITGRVFDVNTLYLSKPESNYLDATLTAILQTHLDAPLGDILAFLTGKDEIDSMCQMLQLKKLKNVEILRLYGSLPPHLQHLVFKNKVNNNRRIILSTNIAETSITINDIKYVIDCGKVKRRIFSPINGIDIYDIENISKEEAWQRTGRTGRTAKGFCLRLYTENHFEYNMNDIVKPDILRANLCNVILQLKSIGINDILNFDFMDKPSNMRIIDGIGKLIILGALDINTQCLTKLGRKMCIFPLDPMYSKIILSAQKYENNIVNDILIIVSMLSVDGVFYTENNGSGNNNNSHLKFENEFGDHLTLLNVFNCYLSNGCRNGWCKENNLNSKSLNKAYKIYKQLFKLYEMHCGKIVMNDETVSEYDSVCRCLLEGLFINIAYYDMNVKKYKTYVNNNLVDIHPSSILFGNKNKPKCVLYSNMIKTKNIIWLKCCTKIMNDEWLDNIIPNIKLLTKININQQEKDRKMEGMNDNKVIEKVKNDMCKPGSAVKRMHSVYESVKNGKFDFKSHRKKMKQNNRMKMVSMMQMVNMNQYQMSNGYNNYNKYRNRPNNRNNNRYNKYNKKRNKKRNKYANYLNL